MVNTTVKLRFFDFFHSRQSGEFSKGKLTTITIQCRKIIRGFVVRTMLKIFRVKRNFDQITADVGKSFQASKTIL